MGCNLLIGSLSDGLPRYLFACLVRCCRFLIFQITCQSSFGERGSRILSCASYASHLPQGGRPFEIIATSIFSEQLLRALNCARRYKYIILVDPSSKPMRYLSCAHFIGEDTETKKVRLPSQNLYLK